MLLADPVRRDNWDRLLLGMSLFAGEDFEPNDFHPYRNSERSGEETDEQRKERMRNEALTDDTLTTAQKLAIVQKINSQ